MIFRLTSDDFWEISPAATVEKLPSRMPRKASAEQGETVVFSRESSKPYTPYG
ncbi:unnamed protein product, partial [Nesidiocoris tenuis]